MSGSPEHQEKSQDAVAVCKQRERKRKSWRDAGVELGLPCICPVHRFMRRQVLCRGLSESLNGNVTSCPLHFWQICFCIIWKRLSEDARVQGVGGMIMHFSTLSFSFSIFLIHMHSYNSCITFKQFKGHQF